MRLDFKFKGESGNTLVVASSENALLSSSVQTESRLGYGTPNTEDSPLLLRTARRSNNCAWVRVRSPNLDRRPFGAENLPIFVWPRTVLIKERAGSGIYEVSLFAGDGL